jgi:hypothetical protein
VPWARARGVSAGMGGEETSHCLEGAQHGADSTSINSPVNV